MIRMHGGQIGETGSFQTQHLRAKKIEPLNQLLMPQLIAGLHFAQLEEDTRVYRRFVTSL